MVKKDITSRDDIANLVHTFYCKIRQDELLGPIFNSVINDWDSHLELLTDFWETNLFFIKKYAGNPLQKHVEVDKQFNNSINEFHFGTWLTIWHQTIDDMFEGSAAQLAKNRSRNMSTFINLEIFNSRND